MNNLILQKEEAFQSLNIGSTKPSDDHYDIRTHDEVQHQG